MIDRQAAFHRRQKFLLYLGHHHLHYLHHIHQLMLHIHRLLVDHTHHHQKVDRQNLQHHYANPQY